MAAVDVRDVRRRTGAGTIVEVSYPASEKPGELAFGVTYRVWIPDGVARLRGVIVHQHGCGAGACKGGETAADDLHWQALARKWDCALLGPSYQQEDGQNCRLLVRPAQRLAQAFLQALDDLAAKSGHPELATVPWCLWGHSGGGFWASLMQTSDPERIVAVWLRSGTAFAAWEKGEIPKPEIPEAAYRIPVMCNPGAKEKDDKRFNGAWDGHAGDVPGLPGQGGADRLRARPAHRPRVRRLALPGHPVLRRLPGRPPARRRGRRGRSSSRWTCRGLAGAPCSGQRPSRRPRTRARRPRPSGCPTSGWRGPGWSTSRPGPSATPRRRRRRPASRPPRRADGASR